MEEYYFLFALGLIYVIIASISDIRKTEVANWLSFSLISFALAYRVFYSIFSKDINFLLYGIVGFVFFFILANCFYYAKVFGGGDAKFLLGFGLLIPFTNYLDIFILGTAFVLFLFFVGTGYTLIYSVFLALKNKEKFKKVFNYKFKNNKKLYLISLIFIILLLIETIYLNGDYTFWLFSTLFLLLTPMLYIYLKSLEEGCMIRLVHPSKLTEGDWLTNDVKVGSRVIKKSVHGLDYKEIEFLIKHNKKVSVVYGIPFIPSFLITWIITVLVWTFSNFDFAAILYSLF